MNDFRCRSEAKGRLVCAVLALTLSLGGCRQADTSGKSDMSMVDISMEEGMSMKGSMSAGEGISMEGSMSGFCRVHEWEWHPLTSPTCASVYEVQEVCAQCGAEGDLLTVGPDEHDWEDRVVTNGNCVDPKVITYSCRVCGTKQPDTVSYENRARALHDYQPYSGSCVEPEYGAVVFYSCDKCSRCGNETNKKQTGFELIAQEETE